jgi:hypothetical protein
VRATQSGSRKRAKRLRDHRKNNHAFNKSIKRAPLCGRPAWLALDSIQDCPTARSVGTQEQRRAQILGILQPCTRSLSQQPLTSPGRVLDESPPGAVAVNSSHSLCRSACSGNRCQLSPVTPMATVQESPQPDAHGLPREARGRQNRLLWAQVGFPSWGLYLQPAARGRPGGAPSGTRLGTRTPIEDSNGHRIRSLEGSRPRT